MSGGNWVPPALKGRIALVTGASRGLGRGIALVLGESGATVYVTGRTVQGSRQREKLGGTIEETARELTRRGGDGIAIRVDHSSEDQVRRLFRRIRSDRGRLDLLVSNAWGGYEGYDRAGWFGRPFWEQSFARWDGMFTAGLRSHLLSCRYGLPLMRRRNRGLVVFTTFSRGERYLGNLFYDVAKTGLSRAAHDLAIELGGSPGVSVVAVSPGWVNTERMIGVAREIRAEMESPEYIGRAVASLAADPTVYRLSGITVSVGDLARIYGFTDIDGRQPLGYRIEGKS